MFVVGLCIIYEVFFLCYRQQQKKKQFKENYTLPLNTISNDNVRVAWGNRKSQPVKVWSINTKYHVVLTNNIMCV